MSVEHQHQARLLAAARGDDGALEALVRQYHGRVHRFGQRVCRDGFDADDAVQEAFAKLARRPDVAAHPGVLSWLMSVVRNACLRLLRPFARQRSRLGEQVDALDEAPSDEPDPEGALERFRLVEAVHRAVASLDGPHREVLVLRDIEGMSGEEVCRALGLSEAAMKSRLHRARQRVREALGPAFEPGR